MSKKTMKRLLIAFLAFCMMFVFNYLREENRGDIDWQVINLPQDRKVVCVVDVNEMGFLKRHLEPDVISLYFRVKGVPKGEPMTFALDNLTTQVSQGSKKKIWKLLEPGDPLLPGKGMGKNKPMPFNLELTYPKDKIGQYHVHEGKVRLLSGDKELSEITVQVINSRYKPE